MQHPKLSVVFTVVAAGAFAAFAPPARAQQPVAQTERENPIPPNVEGQAVRAPNGGYCYGGPHPAPGGGWEASTAPHNHDYAPFDLRLFSLENGCYYFIGDPRDFGYTGETFSYYGAHPVAASYGGGWCFMIGAHAHWWRPWSPYFTVVGPWYYWNGPYDPFFWSYWPYYSFYYRSYYPSYYAGGAYYRTWRPAPAITRVPPTGWRGGPGTWHGAPGGSWRGAPAAGVGGPRGAYGGPGGGWHGSPGGTVPGGGWHGSPGGAAPRSYSPPAGGGWHGSPVPNAAPLHAPPSGGGWHGSPGGGFAPRSFSPPSGGGWHGSPGGGFRGGGSGGGWHGSPGGGFRGGRR